jgi:integrase
LIKKISAKTINSNIISGVIKPVYNAALGEKSCFNTNTDFSLKAKKQRQTGATPQQQTFFILNNLDLWKLYRKDKVMNDKTYKKYRLWCLLSATTGLREGEIFYLQKSNLKFSLGTPFLYIVEKDETGKGLKTDNSERRVPVPTKTLKALQDYVKENNIEDFIFCKSGINSKDTKGFMFAFQQLARHLGFSRQDMIDRRYHFHSLRVLYRTVINDSELREDIIEHFMGHQVDMGSMKERYNNRNDLDDEFYVKYGRIAIAFFDTLMDKKKTYNLTMKDVEFKDKRGKMQKYRTSVIDESDKITNDEDAWDPDLIQFVPP